MTKMRSPLSAICLLLTLGRTTFISATTLGYECDNEFFEYSELQKVAEQAITLSRLEDPSLITLKRLSNQYDGPPFTKPYLLWPISRKTEHYKEAARTPYRVVLDENFEVFSVIMKRGKNVRECKMRENFSNKENKYDYSCIGKLFKNEVLNKAAKAACPQLQDGSMTRFPARYDGPYEGDPFNTHGRQLYLFPLLQSGVYEHDSDPGSHYLLLNSKCQIESVLRKKESSSYARCTDVAYLPSPKIFIYSIEEYRNQRDHHLKHRHSRHRHSTQRHHPYDLWSDSP